jgi:MFS family permease
MTDGQQSPPISPLRPFTHTNFRNLWLANLGSNFGTLIQGVAAAWLMTSITDSVALVALVQACSSLPIMLLALLGGAIADSFDRRRVMLMTQAVVFFVSAALAVTTYLGFITPALLLTFTFLVGCGNALNNPSWHASVGDLVPRDELPSAVALNSIGFNLSRSVGPAVGGALIGLAGPAAAFAVNALSYVPLFGVMLRWRPPDSPRLLPRESVLSAISSGFRYVAMSPRIGRVLVRSFSFGVTAIAIPALLPVVAGRGLYGGPVTYGLLLGAFGVGAVGGALVMGRLQRRFGIETMVRAGFLAFAMGCVIVAFNPSPWFAAVGLLICGASWVIALSLFNVSVQLGSPRWVVGRALSFYQTSTFAGMAIGSWVWGNLAASAGLTATFVAASVILVLGAAIGVHWPLPVRPATDLDPANHWQTPTHAVPLEPRSGPIVIELAYHIEERDLQTFMAVMAERRRIRRRDGARHWRLMRDLADPTRWIEVYRSPTWTDYLRHNMRRTIADGQIAAQLHSLNGGKPPMVTRYVERPINWPATQHQQPITDPL